MGELLFQKTAAPFPVDDLPEVIIDAEADFVDFYNLAWNQAWDHVYEYEQASQLSLKLLRRMIQT